MNIFHTYHQKLSTILDAMTAEGVLPAGLDLSRVKVEPPKDFAHGDMATNAAMVLAKPAGKNPRAVADDLVTRLKKTPGVKDASVAGPGFVNFRLNDAEWAATLRDILTAGVHYGDSDLGKRESIKSLAYKIKSLNPAGASVVGICGLGGAGKTTLAKDIADVLGSDAVIISADDFINVSSSQRKGYLTEALAARDMDALKKLAQPQDPAKNPYASPLSWYDWQALADCLKKLKAGQAVERKDAWNQQTGACDRNVVYKSPSSKAPVYLLDSIYLFEPVLQGLMDYKIMLDLPRDLADKRAAARDSHRSDQVYRDYKAMLADLYDRPYLQKHLVEMDLILSVGHLGEKVNVEYVSVNPTGPMHAGHVRSAVIGDTLANLMQKAGFDVTREYYFNDAGTQVDVLSRTTYLRYREALGEMIEIPEGMYPGEYLKDVAQALVARDGKKWLGKEESEWLAPVRAFACAYMVGEIRKDLALIGIKHDVFTNEREIVENGTLEKVFKTLVELDLIYQGTLPPPKGKEMDDWEPAELTLFRSTRYGDSSDRPLKKRDGTWAYIMPDIAYHADKMRRGFNKMINLLGKDHGNYLDKMRPAMAALSDGRATLDVVFCGMVKIFKNGVPVKLSKRSGNLITLREMVEEVGADAVRFFIMTRTPDSELEFDFAKVVEQTRDNPVFYVQYAHARCCSVLRNGAAMFPGADLSPGALAKTPLGMICSPEEISLIRLMAGWPRAVEAAAEAREPHRVVGYLNELAAEFHGFWNKGRDDASLRFLIEGNKDLSMARLALVKAVSLVVASGLAVMGVTPMEEMHG